MKVRVNASEIIIFGIRKNNEFSKVKLQDIYDNLGGDLFVNFNLMNFERDLFKGYYLKEEVKIMVTKVEWVYEKYYLKK